VITSNWNEISKVLPEEYKVVLLQYGDWPANSSMLSWRNNGYMPVNDIINKDVLGYYYISNSGLKMVSVQNFCPCLDYIDNFVSWREIV